MAGALSIPMPGPSAADLVGNLSAPAKKGVYGTQAKAMAAAKDFESVFINTMFQQMTVGLDGDGPFGGSGATGVWRSMLTDEYAKSFAKAGGLGIADQVYRSLMAHQEAAS
jgi:Rod binding domain-containing protein